jgi:hypothetical protein
MRKDVMLLDSSRLDGLPIEPLWPNAAAEQSLPRRLSGPPPTGWHASPYVRPSTGDPSLAVDDAPRLVSGAASVGGAKALPVASARMYKAAKERVASRANGQAK